MGEGSIRTLDPDECRELLAVNRVGRVAFIDEGRINLLPVNYLFASDQVFVRTSPESALAQLSEGNQEVAFETDYQDSLYRSGWSVLVQGAATEASDEQVAILGQTGPAPWVPGEREVLLAISLDRIEGRRVRGA